jgi:hypothetical protein
LRPAGGATIAVNAPFPTWCAIPTTSRIAIMSEPRDDELWECANRISDKIVDLLNGELAAPDYTPSQG